MTSVAVERGFAEATIARVVARAGVSRRTFYDLFEDREECLLAAFELALDRLAAVVVPVYTSDGHWAERLRRALTVLLASFDEEPKLARLCLVETPKGGPRLIARRRRVLETLARAVDEARREPKAVSPPPLTAEGAVGGAIAIVYSRLVQHGAEDDEDGSPSSSSTGQGTMVELVGPLMSMIVNPYLGPVAARRELQRPAVAAATGHTGRGGSLPEPVENPFEDLPIRITFRTVRVLSTVGEHPGASNRDIAQASDVPDQGQMSKLLRRLERAGLIDNHGHGQPRGEANAWRLTRRGRSILDSVGAEEPDG